MYLIELLLRYLMDMVVTLNVPDWMYLFGGTWWISWGSCVRLLLSVEWGWQEKTFLTSPGDRDLASGHCDECVGGDGDEDLIQACRRVLVPATRSWDITHQVLKIFEVFRSIVPLFVCWWYHHVFVLQGKNCPKTLGSCLTLTEKTLKHSRYFSLFISAS